MHSSGHCPATEIVWDDVGKYWRHNSRQDEEENFREYTHIFAHTYDITKILKLVRNEASVENTCMRENMKMLCKGCVFCIAVVVVCAKTKWV